MRIRTFATLVAAGALLAIPAVGDAHHKTGHTKGGNGGGSGKSCTKKPNVNKGYVVKGTFSTLTANPESITISVTGANKHARVSGELTDTNANQSGVQVAGGSYTVDHVNPTDAFTVQLRDYEPGESPDTDDAVRIVGKVSVERKKCAEPGDTVADRYGTVDIRRVKIVDND